MIVRLICETLWTLWFGGLTFYIAIVVPIGGRVIGSDIQGEITAQVTFYLNLLAIFAAGSTVVLSLLFGCKKHRTLRWSFAAVIAIVAFGLVALRYVMLARMPGAGFDATGGPLGQWSFYSLHRLYLWSTTLQWGCGVGICVLNAIDATSRLRTPESHSSETNDERK